ncbi:MAG: hypothetical protein WCW17_04230 [Patescibacteria group bacterium]|jgi:hypothetical protein
MEQNINQSNFNASGGEGGVGGGHGGSGGTIIMAQVDAMGNLISDKDRISELERRMSIYEFLIAVVFSVCLVLIYGIIKIQHIYFYPYPMISLGVMFFSIAFLSVQFIFFILNVVVRVGTNLKLISKKIASEWKGEKIHNKVMILLGIPSSIFFIYQFFNWIAELIIKNIK